MGAVVALLTRCCDDTAGECEPGCMHNTEHDWHDMQQLDSWLRTTTSWSDCSCHLWLIPG